MAEPMSEDSAANQATRLQASYGTACVNCVKSKTRCAAASDGGKCERYAALLSKLGLI